VFHDSGKKTRNEGFRAQHKIRMNEANRWGKTVALQTLTSVTRTNAQEKRKGFARNTNNSRNESRKPLERSHGNPNFHHYLTRTHTHTHTHTKAVGWSVESTRGCASRGIPRLGNESSVSAEKTKGVLGTLAAATRGKIHKRHRRGER